MMFRIPKPIKPELVQIGDDITVTHAPNKGIVTSVRGVVARREDHGSVRHLVANEGGSIIAWEPGKDNKVRVVLHGRVEVNNQETLFEVDLLTGVKDRVV